MLCRVEPTNRRRSYYLAFYFAKARALAEALRHGAGSQDAVTPSAQQVHLRECLALVNLAHLVRSLLVTPLRQEATFALAGSLVPEALVQIESRSRAERWASRLHHRTMVRHLRGRRWPQAIPRPMDAGLPNRHLEYPDPTAMRAQNLARELASAQQRQALYLWESWGSEAPASECRFAPDERSLRCNVRESSRLRECNLAFR